MIWHITDNDEGIEETDLRIALNRIQLEQLDIMWELQEHKVLVSASDQSGKMASQDHPDLLSLLKELGQG